LVGLLTLIALGLGAATAEAGGCHRGGGYSSSYCNYTPSYCNYTPSYCSYPSYNYCNYPSYDYSCFYPKTCSYPVTAFDCYGRPYTVWQTGYGSTPVAILP
jgi:hypothetical protein